MKIKVGNKWFIAEPGTPLMVQLSAKDKENIKNMLPECDRYASMEKDDYPDVEAMYAWMDEGYNPSWKEEQ